MPSLVFINQINSFFEDLIKALPNHTGTVESNSFVFNPEAMPTSFEPFNTYVVPVKGHRLSTEVEVSNLLYLLREAALRRPNVFNDDPHTILTLIAYFHRVLAERFELKVNNIKGLDYTLSTPEQNAPWVALAKNLGLLLKNARASNCIDEDFYNAHTRRFQCRTSTGEIEWMINHLQYLLPLLEQDIDPISLQPLIDFDLSELVYSETIISQGDGTEVIKGSVMLLQNCLNSYEKGFGLLNVDTLPHQLITEEQRQQIEAKFPNDAQPDWMEFIATHMQSEPSVSIDTLQMLHLELCALEGTNQYSAARLHAIDDFSCKFMDWSQWPGGEAEKHKFVNQIIFVPSKFVPNKFVPTTVQALVNLLEGSDERTERQEGDKKGEKEFPGCSSGTILNLRRLFLDYGMKQYGPRFPAVKKTHKSGIQRSKVYEPPFLSSQPVSSLGYVDARAYARFGLYGEDGYKTPPSDDGLTTVEGSVNSSPDRSPGSSCSGSPPKDFGAWLLPPPQVRSSLQVVPHSVFGLNKRVKPRGNSLGSSPDDGLVEKISAIRNSGTW
jgi:hypothetical protein